MQDNKPHLNYDEETLQKSPDSEKAFLEIMEQKLDGDWSVLHFVRCVYLYPSIWKKS